MESLDRLKRIELLLKQMKEQSFVKSDKKFDRIEYHLAYLDQDYKERVSLREISIEEFELLRKILSDYQYLRNELCNTRDQLRAERTRRRHRTDIILKGYFNKSIIKRSRVINDYK